MIFWWSSTVKHALSHTVELPIWGSIVEWEGGGLNRLVPFEYVARKSTSTEGIYFWLTLFHAISSTTRGESRKNAPQFVDHSACVFCCWSAAVLINDASEGNVCDRKFQDPSIGRRIFYFHCLFEENAQTVALFNATIYLWGEDAIGNEVTGAHLMDTEPNIVSLLVYVVLHHPPANNVSSPLTQYVHSTCVILRISSYFSILTDWLSISTYRSSMLVCHSK